MSKHARVATSSLVLLTVFGAGAVRAQQPSTVRIAVVDTAGVPIANADVTILVGLSDVVAHGVTDAAGLRTLPIPAAGGYQVVARRLGYARGSLFFKATTGSIAVRLPLSSAAASLPTINVTAANGREKSYHLDADDIATSNRPMVDAWDVINVLRPGMVNSYTPTMTVNGHVVEPCTFQFVWVNGKRVVFTASNERLALEKRHVIEAQKAARANPSADGHGSGVGLNGIASVNLTVLSVLASIKPEHIDEINYTDCNDRRIEKANARNAAFVVLKRGVKFSPGIGSYIDSVPQAIAGNRLRLIGIYDERSGEALPGVEIKDVDTGTFILTSETGAAHLAFLSDGAHTLRLHKQGYEDQNLAVAISAEDLTPITVTLTAPVETPPLRVMRPQPWSGGLHYGSGVLGELYRE